MKKSVPFLRWFDNKKATQTLTLKLVLPELLYLSVIAISYVSWNTSLSQVSDYIFFSLWAVVALLLFTLAIDNERTLLLKNDIIIKLFFAVVVYRLAESVNIESFSNIPEALIGAAVLGGFPYLIFQLSQGKWIGGGDVKLGFVAGLFLGWQLSIIALIAWIVLALLAFSLIALFRAQSALKTPSGVIWVGIIVITFLFGQNLIDLL